MKRNSVLKKFDKEIENLFDALDGIKDLLESTDDYELAELGNNFVDLVGVQRKYIDLVVYHILKLML